jgi:hypothetical protein
MLMVFLVGFLVSASILPLAVVVAENITAVVLAAVMAVAVGDLTLGRLQVGHLFSVGTAVAAAGRLGLMQDSLAVAVVLARLVGLAYPMSRVMVVLG